MHEQEQLNELIELQFENFQKITTSAVTTGTGVPGSLLAGLLESCQTLAVRDGGDSGVAMMAAAKMAAAEDSGGGRQQRWRRTTTADDGSG